MRFPIDELDTLREWIAALDTPQVRDLYARGEYPRAKATDDRDMRYRWDLWWAAMARNDADYAWRDRVTAGLDDAHIDTALRRIVPTLREGVST